MPLKGEELYLVEGFPVLDDERAHKEHVFGNGALLWRFRNQRCNRSGRQCEEPDNLIVLGEGAAVCILTRLSAQPRSRKQLDHITLRSLDKAHCLIVLVLSIKEDVALPKELGDELRH